MISDCKILCNIFLDINCYFSLCFCFCFCIGVTRLGGLLYDFSVINMLNDCFVLLWCLDLSFFFPSFIMIVMIVVVAACISTFHYKRSTRRGRSRNSDANGRRGDSCSREGSIHCICKPGEGDQLWKLLFF